MAIAELPAGDLLENIQRFIDEELMQPPKITDQEGLIETERCPDLFADLRRDRQRQVACGVIGREVEKSKNDKADDEQCRHGKKQPPQGKLKHRKVSRPSGDAKCRLHLRTEPAIAASYFLRDQSATFQSSESQPFILTPSRVAERAETWPR